MLFVHSTIPRPNAFRRSSVSRIGDAAAREAASCEQSFFGKRSTDGAIVAKRRERTIHVQHVNEARSQTRSSQTGITLQCIAYCNKEHSHQSTYSLLYRWESCRRRITGASTHGTLQRPGHSLGRYTCPVTTMPQQS